MNLDEYRITVRPVACPHCHAQPGENCVRPAGDLDPAEPVDYVHDGRSQAYHEAIRTQVLAEPPPGFDGGGWWDASPGPDVRGPRDPSLTFLVRVTPKPPADNPIPLGAMTQARQRGPKRYCGQVQPHTAHGGCSGRA